MAAPQISLSELRPGRCARIVVTRLLRFWEARNAKKGGELMGVDMLLLDDQSSLIQASVPVHRLNTFRELLREGAMYELSGFDVSRSNNHFKLFDSVVAIWLNEFKKMVEVPAVANHIPTEMFRFRSVEQLMSLANTNVELPDIIGEVSDIRTTYNDHTQTTQRVMVNIRVDNDATVCVSVFYSVAELLHKRLEHGVVQPKVMVATNINPKFVGGRLYLNATSGAHFYFDNEVAESQRLFEELSSKPDSDSTSGKSACRLYEKSANLQHETVRRPYIDRNMFTAWMVANETYEEARELTFVEFPSRFTYHSDEIIWTPRQKVTAIGRITYIHPSAGDLYYLRILVNLIRGPSSFDALHTVGDVMFEEFQNVCYARGLLDDDKEWHEAVDEASYWATGKQLRRLFVLLLIYYEIGNPLKLWKHVWRHLAEGN